MSTVLERFAERGAVRPRTWRRGSLAAVLGLLVLAIAAGGAWWLHGSGTRPVPVIEYALASAKEAPTAIAAGPDGTIWFTMDRSKAIGRIRVGKLERLPTGGDNSEPLGLAVGADGSAWYTDIVAGGLVRVTRSGDVTRIALDTPLVRLGRLAIAPDNAIWFAEPTGYSITQVKDGSVIRHTLDALSGVPYGVAAARDGTIWATLQAANQLVRIDRDGRIETIDIPHRTAIPTDIAISPDGSVWFLEFRASRIGRWRPTGSADGQFSEYEPGVPGNAGLSGLAVGADGAVWFGMLRDASLGRLRDGRVTVFPLPRKQARPYSVAVDPAGNVWYADISGTVGMLPAHAARE